VQVGEKRKVRDIPLRKGEGCQSAFLGTQYVIRFALCAMMHYRSADRHSSSYFELWTAIFEDSR
jgi:hypothetical protein